MYALKIDEETGRILYTSICLPNGKYVGMPIVDTLPEGNLPDYRYIDGEYVYDPVPKEEIIEQPSQNDLIEAQITYTAMMTDTLLIE